MWSRLIVTSFLHMMGNLSLADNTMATVKKAQYFIKLLKKSELSRQPLTQAYRGLVESILTSGITVWFGNTTQATLYVNIIHTTFQEKSVEYP